MTVTADQLAERKRWVRALLSDDYVQGTSALCRVIIDEGVTQHCCLGVYQHLLDPEHDGLQIKSPIGTGARILDSAEGTLDDVALEKLGWVEQDQEAAYEFNDSDSEPWTFKMIARGIGWTTSQDLPFHALAGRFVTDEVDGSETWAEPEVVPDDFDVEAWLAS